jgi:protein gp37
MIHVMLSEGEWELLGEVAEEYLAELHDEIRDTDDHEYKVRLRLREDTLRSIVEKLEAEHSSRV